MMEVLIGLVDW